MRERDRLVRKYLLLMERSWEDRMGRRTKPLMWPWAYRAGLTKAIHLVRDRIDQCDIQRLAA